MSPFQVVYYYQNVIETLQSRSFRGFATGCYKWINFLVGFEATFDDDEYCSSEVGPKERFLVRDNTTSRC